MKKKIDISGDFDIVIPNVSKEKFEKLLENNFYHRKSEKCCIVYNKNKITELPDKFHLFVEVGLDVYKNEFRSKSRQIYKYISILNIENLIDNKRIKSIYHKNFQERYGLNFNTKQNIADTNVYMLISNSSYEEFKKRFLDNKEFKKEKEKEKKNVNNIETPEDIKNEIKEEKKEEEKKEEEKKEEEKKEEKNEEKKEEEKKEEEKKEEKKEESKKEKKEREKREKERSQNKKFRNKRSRCKFEQSG